MPATVLVILRCDDCGVIEALVTSDAEEDPLAGLAPKAAAVLCDQDGDWSCWDCPAGGCGHVAAAVAEAARQWPRAESEKT